MSKDSRWPLAQFVRIASLAAAGVLLLLWVGCGGGNDSEGTANPETLSKTQFVKQANAICEKGLKEKDEAVQQALAKSAKSGQNSSQGDLEKIVSGVVLPRFEQITRDLAELPLSPKGEGTVENILRKFEAALKETEEDPSKMLKSNPFIPASEAAAAYGLTACNF